MVDGWSLKLHLISETSLVMDNCRHVGHMRIAKGHSVLNPEKWQCSVCFTTESVWACLSCAHVACGRYNQEHALKHYRDTKHPLAIEVNDKYVFCYTCDDYVLNDNAASDIKILRSALSAVASQSFTGIEKRGRRILRSQSFHGLGRLQADKYYKNEDIGFTVVKFRRYYLLAKVFSGWKSSTSFKQRKSSSRPLSHPVSSCTVQPSSIDPHSPFTAKHPATATKLDLNSTSISSSSSTAASSKPTTSSAKKRRAITPGNTGLRNLGNTCYMNSILQALSHLTMFRDYFINASHSDLDLDMEATNSSKLPGYHGSTSKVPAMPSYQRQSTIECFQYITSKTQSSYSIASGGGMKGGLNGGSSTNSTSVQPCSNANSKYNNHPNKCQLSLYTELHTLLRVMWCGKYAIVSPHRMLDAVWQLIPFFKGYSQQDAQEFLCELLDKIQAELRPVSSLSLSNSNSNDQTRSNSISKAEPHERCEVSALTTHSDIVDSIFQGELVSEVTCLVCGHTSQTYEPFMDLSLEFPDRYQPHNASFLKAASETMCSVEEMLSKFTETEKLDGKIYNCEQCNKRRHTVSLTEAKKKISIHRLPKVLRLHLKRFIIPENKNIRTPKPSTEHSKSSSSWSARKMQHISTNPDNHSTVTPDEIATELEKSADFIESDNKSNATSIADDNSVISECSSSEQSLIDLHTVTIDTTIDHAYAMSPTLAKTINTRANVTRSGAQGKNVPKKNAPKKKKTAVKSDPKPSSGRQTPTMSPSLFSSGVSSRWSGRNHRGKINVHVNLEAFLDISPYLYSKRMRHHRKSSTNVAKLLGKRSSGLHNTANETEDCFKLTSVIMHHGRGFGSGHYTAYCYNKDAESWVHYNDAHITLCTLKEVVTAQAYILFYERVKSGDEGSSVRVERVDDDVTFNYSPKKNKAPTSKYTVQPKLKRQKTTTW